jgi:two-component system response regulator VanR
MAKKKNILIIEDDKFLIDLYAELLTDGGHQVDKATDGDQGYQKMKKGGYDLVLLDVMLPKLDGLEILKKLEAEKSETKNKKVVLLTNLSSESVLKKIDKLKVNDCLVKSSLTPDQFMEKVAKHLQ